MHACHSEDLLKVLDLNNFLLIHHQGLQAIVSRPCYRLSSRLAIHPRTKSLGRT